MVTNFPAMLVKQIFPLELTSEYEKKVTNNRDINKTFILPLRSKLFFTKMLLVIWDLMILQLSDFLNQFLIVPIGGLNKEEFFFFELD